MLIDARIVPPGKTIETDVCIVGAGAAGITLAKEFRDQSFRVCLLESGGLEPDERTQSLYSGEIAGLPYPALTVARLRYFGGTTNHWMGWCQPLDDIDFESNDWIPHSGWPFDKSYLVPFYKRAQSILQLGIFAYEPEAWKMEETPPLPFPGDRVRTKIVQFSPPTRFGRVYRDEISQAKNIATYLHANVTEIEATENGRTVTRLHVACLQGNKFFVSARLFVVATGGIENARLLLLSNNIQKAGLGNQYDLVGRFFADHVLLKLGLILLSEPNISTTLYDPPWPTEKSFMGWLIPSPEMLRGHKLGNFCFSLQETKWSDLLDEDDFLTSLSNVIRNLDHIARTSFTRIINRQASPKIFKLLTMFAPTPNPESRVNLTAERDILGQSKVRLQWQLSASDKHTVRRSQEILARELGRSGLGRLMTVLEMDDTVWSSSVEHGCHHMGTTRIHIDSKKGVVDQNCKVHGLSNLFIAGSSVFPTYGYAQPTLTIVALALRLADHVKTLLN